MPVMSPQPGSLSDQAAFYDKRWLAEEGSYIGVNKLERIAAIVTEIARLRMYAPTILEVGSGRGQLSGILSEIGKITALELSPEATRLAHSRYRNVIFECGDFMEWENPRAAYDVVIAHEVIEHIQDQASFVMRAHRALRKNGRIVLTTPNERNFRLTGALEHYMNSGSSQPTENLLTTRQLLNLLRRHFVIENHYTLVREGKRGIYRVINSRRMAKFALWSRLVSMLPVGLHNIVVARAR